MAHEGAIDPALGGSRRVALLREPVGDRALAPERVQPPQLQHSGLGRPVDLVGDVFRPVRAVRERLDPARLVTAQPGVQALASHPELLGHLCHSKAVFDDAHDGVVTLLHLAEPPEHLAAPLPRPGEDTRAGPRCKRSAECA